MRRIVRWILTRTALATLRVILRLVWGLTGFVIRELLSGLAVWMRSIPESCDEVASRWEERANEAGVGIWTRPIYFITFALTLIEIVVVSIVLAHILVFAIFAAVLYL